MLFVGAAYNISAVPSGWTSLYIFNTGTWNGLAASRLLTSGDIATGSVTVSFTGSYDYVGYVVTFIGATWRSARDRGKRRRYKSTAGSDYNERGSKLGCGALLPVVPEWRDYSSDNSSIGKPDDATNNGNNELKLAPKKSDYAWRRVRRYLWRDMVSILRNRFCSGNRRGSPVERWKSVTSVGLAMPTEFAVAGSPISGAGTLTATKATQSAATGDGWGQPAAARPRLPSVRLLQQTFRSAAWRRRRRAIQRYPETQESSSPSTLEARLRLRYRPRRRMQTGISKLQTSERERSRFLRMA